MSNCTAPPVPSQPPAALLIQSRDPLYELIDCCPTAQTYIAFSRRLLCHILIPLGCKRWSCRWCAEIKIKKLAAQTKTAKPSRMMTLTVDPKLWESPRAAFDGTRAQVPELIRRLRKRYGTVEYLRVTELTKKGWPHYHLLLRSNFIPHAIVKMEWEALTGATVVDLRQVKKTFQAYNYLVKYLSKLHKIEWTERHVSYSRNFFATYKPEPKEDLDLIAKRLDARHPVSALIEDFRGYNLTHAGNHVWHITPNPIPEDWQ